MIAGRGGLPVLIRDTALAEGRPLFIAALEDQADPDLVEGIPHVWRRIGAVGGVIDALRNAGVEDVVFAGGVHRPSLLRLGLDARARGLWKKVGAAALGDDKILTVLVNELESEGFRVVGADEILGGLLVGDGILGRHRPDDIALRDIARGIRVARALGALDVGQAAVVQQDIVLGVEGPEGTDGLIARAGELAREGPGGVLVKVKKPEQERRADLPTIGVATVRACRAAGLRGIAVEAGHALILGREEAVSAADEAGLFITGVKADA